MPSLPPPLEEWGQAKTLPPWGTSLPSPLRGAPAGTGRTVPHGGAASPYVNAGLKWLFFRRSERFLLLVFFP